MFTGAVYHAHFDAFRRLAAAPASTGTSARLNLCTATPEDVLRAEGIAGSVAVHAHVPHDAVPQIQQDADVLFLPLAFDSPIPDVVRTSAPAKMRSTCRRPGRSSCTRRPTPSFRLTSVGTECGLVVSDRDAGALAAAVRRLVGDTAFRVRPGCERQGARERGLRPPARASMFARTVGLAG